MILTHLITGLLTFLFGSIYSLSFTTTDGHTVHLSDYTGKRILLVNIATNCPHASQIGELQQLQEEFGDSLVVIAFPSNSFGHESRSDSAIKAHCMATYGTTFTIAQKGDVKGTGIQPVYDYISKFSDNEVMDGVVVDDYQKFLIDEEGYILGLFAPALRPTSPLIKAAIRRPM